MRKSFDEYDLGIDSMDDMHHEYLMLFDTLISSSEANFTDVFEIFIDHIQRHFTNEHQLMLKSEFNRITIHQGEHESVLERLEVLLDMAKGDQVEEVRKWMKKNMPDWFVLHLRTMDSALALHLKESGITAAGV